MLLQSYRKWNNYVRWKANKKLVVTVNMYICFLFLQRKKRENQTFVSSSKQVV